MNPNEIRDHCKTCSQCSKLLDTMAILTGIIQGHKEAEDGK